MVSNCGATEWITSHQWCQDMKHAQTRRVWILLEEIQASLGGAGDRNSLVLSDGISNDNSELLVRGEKIGSPRRQRVSPIPLTCSSKEVARNRITVSMSNSS